MNAALVVMLLASAPAPAGWSASFKWPEGGKTRHAWVSPVELVEVDADEAGAKAVQARDATATAAVLRGAVRLWTVKDAGALRAALPEAVRSRFVPVLHEGRSTRSGLKVALGGVVVVFDASVKPSERGAWVAAHGGGAWTALGEDGVVVATAPHEAAFETAARLAKVPGVVLAVPDFFRAGVAK